MLRQAAAAGKPYDMMRDERCVAMTSGRADNPRFRVTVLARVTPRIPYMLHEVLWVYIDFMLCHTWNYRKKHPKS